MGSCCVKQELTEEDIHFLKKHTRYDEETIREWYAGFLRVKIRTGLLLKDWCSLSHTHGQKCWYNLVGSDDSSLNLYAMLLFIDPTTVDFWLSPTSMQCCTGQCLAMSQDCPKQRKAVFVSLVFVVVIAYTKNHRIVPMGSWHRTLSARCTRCSSLPEMPTSFARTSSGHLTPTKVELLILR